MGRFSRSSMSLSDGCQVESPGRVEALVHPLEQSLLLQLGHLPYPRWLRHWYIHSFNPCQPELSFSPQRVNASTLKLGLNAGGFCRVHRISPGLILYGWSLREIVKIGRSFDIHIQPQNNNKKNTAHELWRDHHNLSQTSTSCDRSITISDKFLIVTNFSVTIFKFSVTNLARTLCVYHSITNITLLSQFPSQVVTDSRPVTKIHQNKTFCL